MIKLLHISSWMLLLLGCNKLELTDLHFSNLEAFSEIEIKDAFEVVLKEGQTYSLTISADQDLIDQIQIMVENDILIIQNTRKVKWLTPTINKITLNITSPPLRKLTAAEGCSIRTASPVTSAEFGLILTGKANEANLELDCHTFYYWNNFPSGGQLLLSGKTKELKIWNTALMTVDAKNLNTNYAYVQNNSKGDCEITVLSKLEYGIGGEGNIHLYGHPPEIIPLEITASGRLFLH